MIIRFIVFGVLFLGGMLLMGIAPGLPAMQGVVFVGGILSFSLALAVMMAERGGATKRSRSWE
ncbi:hypothetical protein J2Y69_001136 [Microbacterium resistens]|uniref:Uncharacterized protein n=1 Tax=Microbacterium resistens TaxID=156977 RepID=A0ABU1SCA4_9MICO|nr:hypothetical protein [Microbacterium resistens]MDR6866543.1 hypothetical protein [Microbacterium resistens]